MNNKHTPGPWVVANEIGKSGSPIRTINRGVPAKGGGIQGLIAVLPDRCPSAAQWNANARLIAAAPELLEALQALSSLIDQEILVRPLPDSELIHPSEGSYAGHATLEAMWKMTTAIAKATGK